MFGIFGFTDTGIAASSKQEQYLREAAEARLLKDAETACRRATRTVHVNRQQPGPSSYQRDGAVSALHSSGLQMQRVKP